MPLRILTLIGFLLAPLAVAHAHKIGDAALHERHEAQQQRLEQQDVRIENQQRELDDLKRSITSLQQGAPVFAQNANAADADTDASSTPDVAGAPVGVLAPASDQIADAPVDAVDTDLIPMPAPTGSTPVVRYSADSVTRRPSEMFQVSLGGNLNRALNVAADGQETKPYFVDSSNIPTNLYVKTAARLHDDVMLGAHFEAGLQANPALRADQKNENAGFFVDARFYELIADTTKYGKLSFGHGFASSFLASEVDQSGMQFGNLLSVGNTAGGLLFYDNASNDYSDTRIANAFIDGEELALINRIRYDSPRWAGLQLSGTIGQDDFRDVTLRFSGDAEGFVWSSGTSYQNRPNGPFGNWRWNIAGGILHQSSGLNLTVGGAISDSEKDDSTSGFIARLGWRYLLFEVGETKFAVDYTNSWDVVEPGSEERSTGVFAFQNIDWAGLQLYTGYRWYHADVPSADLQNINAFVFGAAMQFDVTWGF
ncbi:MAG TPA: hypothetical protein EYQ66_06420 [Myxococcales bacterium]|nr:hypothetical protein [Myxococcales bacterium]